MFKDGVGRKFLACMSVQGFHILLLSQGMIAQASYDYLTMFLIGGYVSGNIAQRVIESKGKSDIAQ